MASLNITPEELKALEQTRQRLQQVSDSIGTLKNGVITSSPLPNLVSLQNSADILQATMRSLLTNMSNNDELFSRLAVHPSTNFPGRTQENILLQLLRKKPEPDVAASLDEGRKAYAELDDSLKGEVKFDRQNNDDDDEDEELSPMNQRWTSLDAWVGKRAQRFIVDEFPEDFTAEELDLGIENVRTGLRRKFEYEDEDDDDDEEDDVPKAAAPPKPHTEEDDVVMLDDIQQPPPPAVPSLQSQASQSGVASEHINGLKLENMLRVATLGHLPR
ncbi:mediator of RNA polymerase II transcription subunit 8 [Pestalotiopsis sp. IQ-011]